MKAKPQAQLNSLSQINWSIILSATLDSELESCLIEYADGNPARRRFTEIADLNLTPPPQTIPIYKLLGSLRRDNFPTNQTQYRKLKILWRRIVRDASDYLKNAPLLCLGMSECTQVLFDLIEICLAERIFSPSEFIILADDPLAQNSDLRDLVEPGMKITIIESSKSKLHRLLSSKESVNSNQINDDTNWTSAISKSKSIVFINEQLGINPDLTQQRKLRSLLFSPFETRWEPFIADLDFKRTFVQKITHKLCAELKEEEFSSCVQVIIGPSASGKTTAMKRIALELAKQGETVFWIRHSVFPDSSSEIKSLFFRIACPFGEPA